MFSELEREVQGKSKKAPPYEKVLAHFLRKRGVRSAVVPAGFPLGYAEALAANKIRVRATNGLFWPEREAKSDKEIELIGRALRITETGLRRAIEILKASKPGAGKRLRWSGKTLTSEMLRAEIDSTILRAGGVPTGTIVAGGDQACDPHERGSGPLSANSLIILDVFPRDAKTGYFGDMTRTVLRGRASEAQRKLWETVKAGQALALKKIKAGVDGMTIHKAIQEFFAERGFPTELRKGRRVGFFHGTGHGLGVGDPRASAFAKSHVERATGADGRARIVLSRTRRRAAGRRGRGHEKRVAEFCRAFRSSWKFEVRQTRLFAKQCDLRRCCIASIGG